MMACRALMRISKGKVDRHENAGCVCEIAIAAGRLEKIVPWGRFAIA